MPRRRLSITRLDTQMREERFVAEYLKDLDGARAVIAAGYSPKNASASAHELLKSPRVAEAIRAQQAMQLDKLDMDAERIKREIFALATLDPAECFNDDGTPITLKKMPARVRACVKSVSVTVVSNQAVACKVEFWNKVDALHLAAKHLALLAPKEVNVNVRFPHAHLTDAELKQRLLESAKSIEVTP